MLPLFMYLDEVEEGPARDDLAMIIEEMLNQRILGVKMKKVYICFLEENEGQYRETDRVTRFKLVKSGKHWLRAATSHFGLFKIISGRVDASSVSVHQVEEEVTFNTK